MTSNSEKSSTIREYVTLEDTSKEEQISFGLEDEKEDEKGFKDDILDFFDIEVDSVDEED